MRLPETEQELTLFVLEYSDTESDIATAYIEKTCKCPVHVAPITPDYRKYVSRFQSWIYRTIVKYPQHFSYSVLGNDKKKFYYLDIGHIRVCTLVHHLDEASVFTDSLIELIREKVKNGV